MIYVPRRPEPPELDLTNSESIGYKELEKAKKTTFTKDTDFPFKAYRNENVKKVLRKMFNGKCGFCESLITDTSYEEVEHFRPKKAIKIEGKEGLTYPGYYWLAMKWENLLIACERCNRTYKKNHFPLIDENKRAKSLGEEDKEEPLLLNPCEDIPSDHLEYTKRGRIRVKGDSLKGETSIDIYGLHRKQLTDERAVLAITLESMVEQIYRDLNKLNELMEKKDAPESEGEIVEITKIILKTYNILLLHVECPKRPFRAMTKQLTLEFFSKHRVFLDNLNKQYNKQKRKKMSHSVN